MRVPSPVLPADLQRAVVEFLREELPPEAREVYRQMIINDPENWWRDPHFSGGVIVEHMLRGNNLTEATLGVPSLDLLWPELLRLAVEQV